MNVRSLLLITAAGAGACSFAPSSSGAGGGDGQRPADASHPNDVVDRDAPTGTEVTVPVDALPLLPDAPPGSCMAKWRSGTIPAFETPHTLMISGIGTVQRDPTLSPDESLLYFSSNLSTAKMSYWFAARSGSGQIAPGSEVESDALGPAAIGADSEGKLTLEQDNLDVIFASDRGGKNQLWHAHRANTQSNFGPTNQTSLDAVNVSGTNLADPQLAGGDLHLYYATDDGTRSQHIVMATRTSQTAAWSAGVTFASLDSGHGDADPSLSLDESTILFSSQRPGGQGGTDLYYATRRSAGGEFGAPQPITGINTASAEGDPVLTHDGCTVIFATDNSESSGDYDLWVARMINP